MRHRLLAVGLVALVAPLWTAGAFTIATGFTDSCHEDITSEAWLRSGLDVNQGAILIPDTGAWRDVSEWLTSTLNVPITTEEERFVFYSLIVGVRSNDTNGHSALNLASLRNAHTDPSGQERHCLRAVDQDGPHADAPALALCREFISTEVEMADLMLLLPPEEQIETVEFTLDFYGTVRVDVWGPAYHVGRALHALEDSFAHTVRSADGRRVHHLMNFVDALRPGDYNEAKDGLQHSDANDDCKDPENAVLVEAAIEAATALLRSSAERMLGGGSEQTETVLQEWMSLEPNCTIDNGYCDSPWLPLAKRKLTAPYLGCSAAPQSGVANSALIVLFLLLPLVFLLARFRWRRHAVWMLLLAASLGCEPATGRLELTVRVLHPPGGASEQPKSSLVSLGLLRSADRLDLAVEESRPKSFAEATETWQSWTSGDGQSSEILVVVGSQYGDLVADSACAFGGRTVLHLDGAVGPCPRLRSVRFDATEPARAAGRAAVAARPGLIGIITGGASTEVIAAFTEGVVEGGGSIALVAAGDEPENAASSLVSQGAGVIWATTEVVPVLGPVLESPDTLVMGYDADFTVRSPERVLGSVLRRFDLELESSLLDASTDQLADGVVSGATLWSPNVALISPNLDDD